MKTLKETLNISSEDLKEVEYLLSIDDLDDLNKDVLYTYYHPQKNDEREIGIAIFEDDSSLELVLHSGATNYWVECSFIRKEDLLCVDGMNNPISHDTILGDWEYEYDNVLYILKVEEV